MHLPRPLWKYSPIVWELISTYVAVSLQLQQEDQTLLTQVHDIQSDPMPAMEWKIAEKSSPYKLEQ